MERELYIPLDDEVPVVGVCSGDEVGWAGQSGQGVIKLCVTP